MGHGLGALVARGGRKNNLLLYSSLTGSFYPCDVIHHEGVMPSM